MNPARRAILAPLLAVLALLCAFAGTASAAFNDAARNPHYGNFLLWESEASGFQPGANQAGTWETSAGFYDFASGRPPWTYFDPLGLASVEDSLKDNKMSYKEAKELEFKDGEAEGILDANKIDKISEKSVRDDIVGKRAFTGEEYVKDNMIWPNEDTGYYKNYQSGMSVDEVVVTETARRNQSKAKQLIVREFKDEKLKQFLQVAEYSSHLMMEGSMFVIPAVGSATARLGTMAASGMASAPAEMATNMVTVTRWQTPASDALKAGDWVVKGGKNPWNWAMSGKMNPGRPRFHVPYKNGRSHLVPESTLAPPRGVESIKALPPWNQRLYKSPTEGGG